MKSFRNEKLSEHLLNVDDALLSNAYEIDSAEKLKAYRKTKEQKSPVYKMPAFRIAVAAAACVALVMGSRLFSPKELRPSIAAPPSRETAPSVTVPPSRETAPGVTAPPSRETAPSVTAPPSRETAPSVTAPPSRETAPSVTAPPSRETAPSVTVPPSRETAPSVTVPPSQATAPSVDTPPSQETDPTENPWKEYISIDSIDMLNYYTAMKSLADSARATDVEGAAGISLLAANTQSEGEKYYYELDPDAKFSVSKVVFFQIRVEKEDGFLASKVGTGVVDVVITENSLEPMITFKNGDRYYSCCQNGGSRTGRTYSSHKYIEGFTIVKNLEQENYSFKVIYDNFNPEYENVAAISLTCEPFGQNSGDAADGKLSIISETYVSDQWVELTLAELEEYCNADKDDSSVEPTVSDDQGDTL